MHSKDCANSPNLSPDEPANKKMNTAQELKQQRLHEPPKSSFGRTCKKEQAPRKKAHSKNCASYHAHHPWRFGIRRRTCTHMSTIPSRKGASPLADNTPQCGVEHVSIPTRKGTSSHPDQQQNKTERIHKKYYPSRRKFRPAAEQD